MQPPYRHPSADPFRSARSISGALIALLCLRAAMRLLTYVTFELTLPPPGEVTADQWNTMKLVDGALLGVENLTTIVTMILVFVWIYRVTKAIRASGGDTTLSPGLAVGGWFIPVANVVLPWLAVRSALRGVGRVSALAGVWWLASLASTSLGSAHQLSRQLNLVPELMQSVPPELLDSLFSSLHTTYWPWFVLDTATWGLLAIIVAMVRKATPAPA